MIEILAAFGILSWLAAVLIAFGWLISLFFGGKLASWKRVTFAVILLGSLGWLLLLWAAEGSASC